MSKKNFVKPIIIICIIIIILVLFHVIGGSVGSILKTHTGM